MIRHSESRPDFQELILRRLALNPESLEQSASIKGLTRYKISREREGDDKRIPQSTILECTKKLEENRCVRRISKTKIGIRKHRITYDITALGMIRWFHYLNNNWNSLDLNRVRLVITRSQRLFPFISNNWSQLKEIFKDDHIMIMTLLWVADIDINTYDINNAGSGASALLNIGGLKVHVSNQVDFPISPGIKTIIPLQDTDHMLMELFTFVYIYTLELKSAHDRTSYHENRVKLFSLIKSDPLTYHTYLKFIKQLQSNIGKAADRINEIEIKLRDNN